MLRNATLAAAVLASIATTSANAEPATELGGLPRRGFVGAKLVSAAKAGREGDGVVVQGVVPGTPSAKAGLEVDDVVLSIDGTPAKTPGEVVQRVVKSPVGTKLAVKVARGGSTEDLTLVVEGRPQEKADGIQVIYDSVTVRDFRVRSIWTKPEGTGPFPTLLIIQGVHCGSMEAPMAPFHESYEIAHRLAKLGYAVMRVEKPGVGDSQGPPCGEIDFDTEVETFRQALANCTAKPFVAKDRVFLFGHSMGGIIAPIIASETQVAGVSAFGTSGLPWQEYLLENSRRQTALAGETPEGIEAHLRASHRFHSLLFEDGLSIAEIREKHPEVAEMSNASFMGPNAMFGRSCAYWQQMEKSPRMDLWKKVDCPVLMVWGEADFVTNARDHEVIVDAVNHWRPGTARYVALPNADHAIGQFPTQEAAAAAEMGSAPFTDSIIPLLDGWMKESAKSAASSPTAGAAHAEGTKEG